MDKLRKALMPLLMIRAIVGAFGVMILYSAGCRSHPSITVGEGAQ
jgi:hypothetical protein